ncbi:MAG: N-acetylneuraminate synthase family protein [Planctomycetota bacterium]|jgi:sialic acid synthase SpsE
MQIGNLNLDEQVMVVAEIGNNHEGSFALAEELVGLAGEAGADAVKFQTFQTQDYVSPRDRSRFERLKSFELTARQFESLSEVAARAGVLFLSTPLDLASARMLTGLVAAFKIASGDNTFYPLLETVAATGKPVILSTGLATLDQIRAATGTIEGVWRRAAARPELAVLHCVSSYPTPCFEANLAAIPRLRAELGCTVGYSDHTLGIDAAALSVAAGARIVEKHFTLDKSYSDFRDHQLSADPADMRELVERITEITVLMGSGEKVVQDCERPAVHSLRRSIAAKHDLARGSVLGPDDLTWVRPAGGLAPGQEHLVVGRQLLEAVAAGEPIVPQILAGEAEG